MKKYIAFISIIFVFVCVFFNAHAENTVFDDSTILAVMNNNRGTSLFSLRDGGANYDALFREFGIISAKNLTSSSNDVALFGMEDEKQVFLLTLETPGEDNICDTIDALNALDEVEYAQPNYFYYLTAVPNDEKYINQYSLPKVGAEYVWSMDIDCSDVTVAVIDTGMMMTHEDLAGNLWINPNESPNGIDDDNNGLVDDIHGWNFAYDNNSPEDNIGHGTHVAGIVSAVTNNGTGVASLARNAKIVPIKVFNDEGKTTTTYLFSAVQYVKKMGFPIVNNSFGGEFGTQNDRLLKESIEQCRNSLFVAAAGNVQTGMTEPDNDIVPIYPSSFDLENLISVAWSDSDDNLNAKSHYGLNSVDIAAPGTSIWSTYILYNGTYYRSMQGTSMATPLVASAAAVLKAKYPDSTPSEIKEALISGADPVSALADKVKSGARLNVYNAIQYLAPTPTPSPSPTPTVKPTATPTATPTVEPTLSPTPTAIPTPTVTPSPPPTIEPIVTPTPSLTPTVEPTATPILSDRVEFERQDDGAVLAKLIFEKTTPPNHEDICVYLTYKENGMLKRIETLQLADMTASFIISNEFEDCDISVYVWDKDMKPLMEMKK